MNDPMNNDDPTPFWPPEPVSVLLVILLGIVVLAVCS